MEQVLFTGDIPGFSIDQVVRETEFTMPIKHMHREYEIYFLLEGACYYFIESETFYIQGGSLVFIGKEKIHKTSAAGRNYQNRILIGIQEEWINPFLKANGFFSLEHFFQNAKVVKLDEEGKRYIEELLADIQREVRRKKIGYESMVKMRMAELFLYVLRSRQKKDFIQAGGQVQSVKFQKVQEVAKYIQLNYPKDLSLQEVADRFFVSKCYLSRIFKDVTGFTVNEYITIQRVKEGKRLLEQSTYNITEISERIGYGSITYFEKIFKKYVGNTPLKYRKNLG